MPLFVDHVGLNTLINDDLDLANNLRTPNFRVSEENEYTYSDAAIKSDAGTENRKFLVGGSGGYSSAGSIEFSFWVKLDTTSTNQRQVIILTNKSEIPSTEIYFESNRIYFRVYDNSKNDYTEFYWSVTMLGFTLGNGRHVYIYYSGDTGTDPNLFLDAALQSSPTKSTVGSPTSTNRTLPQLIYVLDRYNDDANYELDGRLQALLIGEQGAKEDSSDRAAFLYNSNIVRTDISDIESAVNIIDFWLLGNEVGYLSGGDPIPPLGIVVPIDTEFESIGISKTILSNPYEQLTMVLGATSDNPSVIISTTTIVTQLGNHVAFLSDEDEFAGLITHRNGPYGYSTWKQIRVSENPITRYHIANSTMTFVTQPGPIINIGTSGDLRVRSRYSAIYNFREPAIAQKTHPLVWNVGRHFKDEDGQLAEEPQKFSIISSYGNQQIGFANERVDKLLKFDPDEEQTEYATISTMYLDNGLNKQDSPLTYWEFLQYRETVFPHMRNQFQNENLERPTFESFYRHNREDRTRIMNDLSDPKDFGFPLVGSAVKKDSTWTLDSTHNFLTENKINPTNISNVNRNSYTHGVLQSFHTTYIENLTYFNSGLTSDNEGTVSSSARSLDLNLAPYPIYSRRISLSNSGSVSNPSGMEIYGTSSSQILFEGGALWEAGANRYIKDENGEYVLSPKQPFYDTYEHYIEEARRKHKNYSIVPEFRMSTQVEDYRRTNNSIELDMFEVAGGASGSENSSKEDFYTIYSNSDFMRNFEVVNDDHKDFTNGKVISLRCKAVKKFLPYEGFYPAQRTVDLSKRFYDSFKDHIKLYNGSNVEIGGFNYGRQLVMAPLFAPGVLFNTIKSGVAVDYPIITSSLGPEEINIGSDSGYYIYNENFDKRIPFESLVEPHRYLSGYNLTSNEPHPSGNLSASANWDGDGDELYGLMMNNFLAEVPEFFLPNGELTSVVSKRQGDVTLKSGSIYGMRIKMKRSMNGTRGSVYHSGSSDLPYYPPQDVGSGSINRESFTMYSRPSAFGPPSAGYAIWASSGSSRELFNFSDNSFEFYDDSDSNVQIVHNGSHTGQNFPFTPPYYHGEAWCDIILTASSDKMTISEIQEKAEYDYTRFDNSFYQVSSSNDGIQTINDLLAVASGPQQMKSINKNAVQLSASLNIKGIGRTKEQIRRSRDQGLVVDSGLDEDNRWIIQTKFETPMLNFAHVSGSDHLTLPQYGSGSVSRGMWHQHGRIPEENEGVFLEVGPIERNYWTQARGETVGLEDLSEALGFAGTSTKIGRLASSKTISEAVVAVPFIEKEGNKKFFRLALNETQLQQFKDGDIESLTTGEPQSQIGRSVLLQLQKMEKFVFPPSFDFLRFPDVDPVAMYVFEFSHTLSQQDLSDIWQNLPPDIGTEMEVSEVAITHPLLQKELLGQGGEEGNQKIDMPERLQWMVFKVKQRAATNYFKKTVVRNPDVNSAVSNSNVTKDEFGDTSPIQYNWPYDFFSLVELVKIDAEVEFGNADFSEYTDNLPSWEGVSADRDKIEYIVGGLEDAPIPEVQIPEQTITTGERIRGRGGRDLLNRNAPSLGPVAAGTPFRKIEGATGAQLTQAPAGLGAGQVANQFLQSTRDRETARLWMNILSEKARGEYATKGSLGSKSSVRFNTINAALSDSRLNEFMARIGMVTGQGNFNKNFAWELRLSADYGGISIPSEMADFKD